MSIYTYKITHKICEALGIEPHETPSLSDQEIDIIPEDARNYGISGGVTPTTWKTGHTPWNKGRVVSEEERKRLKKICENRVPWNKDKTGLQKHSEEWKLKHSLIIKEKTKNRVRDSKGKFL